MPYPQFQNQKGSRNKLFLHKFVRKHIFWQNLICTNTNLYVFTQPIGEYSHVLLQKYQQFDYRVLPQTSEEVLWYTFHITFLKSEKNLDSNTWP